MQKESTLLQGYSGLHARHFTLELRSYPFSSFHLSVWGTIANKAEDLDRKGINSMKRVGMGVAIVGKQVLGVYHRKEFKDTPNKPSKQ